MMKMRIIIFATILIIAVCGDQTIDPQKTANKNDKRGAVGGIVYATKQTQYAEPQADVSPSRLYAKPSPNVAFSTNTVYTQPQQQQQPVYAKIGYAQPAVQQVQPIPIQYAQPVQQVQYEAQPAQVQYAAQPAQLVQVAPTYAVAPQPQPQPQYTAYKIGYAQPIVQQQQPVQYVQQAAPQPILYHTASAPSAPAAPLRLAYTSAATNQHNEYATAPSSLTKIGYTSPAVGGGAAAYSSAPRAIHYSPASAVSQFSYSSPHVSYSSNGILAQTTYPSSSSSRSPAAAPPQQLSYSASQPIYSIVPAPSGAAPLTLTKLGYSTPAFNYAVHQ